MPPMHYGLMRTYSATDALCLIRAYSTSYAICLIRTPNVIAVLCPLIALVDDKFRLCIHEKTLSASANYVPSTLDDHQASTKLRPNKFHIEFEYVRCFVCYSLS